MKHNQGNRKSLYTRRQIAGALFTLLEEKEYGDLTISELCGKAGCSRPSFYRNFHSADDVFAFSVRDKIDVYLENAGQNEIKHSFSGNYIDMKILSLWGMDREFVTLIVKRGLLNDFIMIICRYLNEILRRQASGKDLYGEAALSGNDSSGSEDPDGKMPQHDSEEEKLTQYRSALQAYYTGAVLYAWADRGLVDSPEEVLKVLSSIRGEDTSETFQFLKI